MKESDDEAKEKTPKKVKKRLKEVHKEFKKRDALTFIQEDHIILLTGLGIENGAPKQYLGD